MKVFITSKNLHIARYQDEWWIQTVPDPFFSLPNNIVLHSQTAFSFVLGREEKVSGERSIAVLF